MSFSLPQFLRRTSPASLREYIEHRCLSGFEGVDWGAKPQAYVDAVGKVINGLSEDAVAKIIEDFERVSQLCGEAGQLAIRHAILDEALLNHIQMLDGDEARGLALLLVEPDLIDNALAAGYADRRYGGRSWSSHRVLASSPAANDSAAREALARDVGTIFRSFDGSGGRLKIDAFERCERKGESRILQFTLYIEGLPETRLEFETDGPQPRSSRPAIEAAICYDAQKGMLDIVARGGREVREKIARGFARNLLGIEDGIEPVYRQRYDLDRLRKSASFPTETVDGIKEVHILLLRLADMGDQFGQVTLEIDKGQNTDIHAASRIWFGTNDPLNGGGWRVLQAKLRITFHPDKPGAREKTITVDLRRPNGSNLRDQTRKHQIIAEKYLERWGLIESV